MPESIHRDTIEIVVRKIQVKASVEFTNASLQLGTIHTGNDTQDLLNRPFRCHGPVLTYNLT